jgi:hypothetical protein
MDDDTKNEPVDSPIDTDALPEEAGTDIESDGDEVDVAKLQATNTKLFERAKKAEAELKALKGTKAPTQQPSSEPQNVEETVLKANGMSDELLRQLKDIAKIRGVSLLDAQKDTLFVAVKNEYDAKEKSKAANVGSSRGSGSPAPKATLATPRLSQADHKALFKERLGR